MKPPYILDTPHKKQRIAGFHDDEVIIRTPSGNIHSNEKSTSQDKGCIGQ